MSHAGAVPHDGAVSHDGAVPHDGAASSWTLDLLVQRCRALARPGRRVLLGITGPPGAGKSTLTAQLVRALAPDALAAPMDGFHLADAELVRLGRRDRKGAPDTFDPAGFVTLLARLRDRLDDVVYAPEFDRGLEEPVAGALALGRDVPLVVIEGNYLLLPEGHWSRVRALLDEVWYLEPDDDVRVGWLVARHVAFGKAPDQARAWTLGSDAANAELIAATRHLADLVLAPPPVDAAGAQPAPPVRPGR